MSLIIAKKIGEEIFIISDTKFTYKEPERNNEKWYSKAEEYLGGLKSILLAPGLCVCFSGEVEFAKNAIENILQNKVNLFDKNKAIDYFLESHVKSNQETGYLLVHFFPLLPFFISNSLIVFSSSW